MCFKLVLSKGLDKVSWTPGKLSKVSGSEMVSGALQLSYGRTDPLEWRQLHPASSRSPTPSNRLLRAARTPGKLCKASGSEILYGPPAVVWSHCDAAQRMGDADRSGRNPSCLFMLSHASQKTWARSWPCTSRFRLHFLHELVPNLKPLSRNCRPEGPPRSGWHTNWVDWVYLSTVYG